jgi:23S rRNA pseudouridine2605 synthase
MELQGRQPETLLHILTRAGVGSRRECFRLIVGGQVRVNGRVAAAATEVVDPSRAKITVKGKPLAAEQPKVYLKLNKPLGVVSTTADEQGRKTVLDLVPLEYRKYRLYPVGRLDVETSGLLLLTNDGDLANHLTHPRFEVEKEYQAILDQELTEAQVNALEKGVRIGGEWTAPARVRRIPDPEPRYSIVVHEGRKHQVRYMFRAVGREVVRLRRVRMDNLRLGGLRAGKAAELTPEELRGLLKLLAPAPKRGAAL